MKFSKYQALGNDYLVAAAGEWRSAPQPEQIRRLCAHHYGVGADGVLVGPLPGTTADFGLRIFNPDGSEAEKSGNGLRIFARWLWDEGRLERASADESRPFTIHTPGGIVCARVWQGGEQVTVEMGRVSFDSREIPLSGAPRLVVDERLQIGGQEIRFCAVTIGNPHCVVLGEAVTPETSHRLGPQIEKHPLFPRRTNVQFLEVLDRSSLCIEIWERGAGYTLASGSSSCAAAAAAYRLGWCDNKVTVHMPGGELQVDIASDWEVTLSGVVSYVFCGEIEEP